jgi:ESCRT-II complex subunit VPS22
MASEQLEQLKQLHAKFKDGLELFAKKHQKEISKNPVLRVHFQKMCTNIGVDPLASSKGFWAEMLGIGDFYYELGVKIVEASLKLREQTGGLIDLQTLKKKLIRGDQIEDDDIVKAIDTLKPLGSGFKIITIGKHKMVQSVPREMSTDTTAVLNLADQRGFFTTDHLKSSLNWPEQRIDNCINSLLSEGLVWIDEQASPKQFWVPGLFAGIA